MTTGDIILTNKNIKYESVFIIRPNIDDEAADRAVASVEEYIKGLGGNIIATEKKGRRRLAYEVKKMRDGFFVLMRFSIAPESVSAVKKMMTLSEDIIRSIIVVLDEAAVGTTL